MVDETTEAPVEAQEVATPNAAEVAREWAGILNALVPSDYSTVTDISGATHRLRANLPASVEQRILRRLKDIEFPDLAVIGERIQSAGGNAQEAIGGALDGVITLLGDEAILLAVSECFEIANPRAVREANENVAADEDLREYLSEGRTRASDLFSGVDLVRGIVPFALRAVSQIGNTVASLLPPTT